MNTPQCARVAFYFHRLAKPGGAERMICQLANALADRGFDVWMISLDATDEQAFYPLHPGVQWKKLGFMSGIADKLRRTRTLIRLLRDNGIEVLVGFVMSGDKTVFAATKLSGARLIVAERNAPAMYWMRYSKLQRWSSFLLMHFADRITVQMPNFVNGYPAGLRDRIEVIPNPVPVAAQLARPGTANEAGRFVLLAVSRLDGVQKRIDCLIRAFARTASQHPAWDLQIVGDGPEEAALQHLITELDMGDRIRLQPATSGIFDIYAESHLFAIPSRWEGFPNALAEALSHGLPSVGFADAAGVADLIAASGGGWLAPGVDDDKSLAETLDRAMSDAPERERRGRLAIAGMAAFAPEKQFDHWADLLGDVVAERKQ